MAGELLGFMMLAALIVFIFVGFPIAFTLVILALVFGYFSFGETVFGIMYFQTLGVMKEYTFAAAPLFLYMGYIFEQAGLMERLFKSFQFILAPVRGSIYYGVTFVATIFAAATGIIGSSITVMGLMAGPVMIKSNYDSRLSAGVITSAGCLGIMIPPSVMLIVMGPVIGVSVLELYAAAIIPGLMLAASYTIYAIIRCQINPKLGPTLPAEERPKSFNQIAWAFITGIIPVGTIILFVLGSILAGMATATEAGAVGCTAATILTLLYRRLTWEVLKSAVYNTLRTSSMVLILACFANVFGGVFSRLGSGVAIANWVGGLHVHPLVTMAFLMLIMFLLGWPLEWPPIVLVFTPIFLPLVITMGYNLVWFGILIAVTMQTSYLSPPVAIAAYYLKAVVPQWSMADIYWGMVYFMVLQLIVLAIVFFYPETALWLPNLLFG